MASLTTYLLVSGIEDPHDVNTHPIVAERDLEQHDAMDSEADLETVVFVDSAALEDAEDLSDAARELSSAFPSSMVQLCVVEERFDQLERVRTVLYRDGAHAGEIEHGYVLNIGSGG